jgi:hypothetical protein
MTGAERIGADWPRVALRLFVEVFHVRIVVGKWDGSSPHVTMCASPLVIDRR